MNMEVRATQHTMVRLDIPTTMSFGDFRRAFEAAAPVAGLGRPEITAVGVELDRKVARLLEAITGWAPAVLLDKAGVRA